MVEDERDLFRVTPVDAAALPAEQDARSPVPAPTVRPRWMRISRRGAVRAIETAIRREAGLGTAFLFLPVALIVGVLAYFALPVEPAPWNAPAGLAVLIGLLFASRGQANAYRRALIVGTTVAAGIVLAQLHTQWGATPMLGSDVTTRLTGRVLAIEARANGRTRYTMAVLKTERPRLRYAPDIVRATAAGAPGELVVGGGIHGVVRLTSPSGPAHPLGYDFAFHSYFDGIGANGFFLGKPSAVAAVPEGSVPGRVKLALEELRQSIGGEIRSAATGRSGAVSAALVTGDKSGIPEDVTEALRVSGLAHILSISGLHMALVAATVMATLRLGFAFFPHWSSRHPVKKYAAGGALAATAFYLFLAGAGVATQRSFIMLAIMLLALTFDRNAVTMRNLALAAIAVVVFAPHEVAGPGFQMSFAATAALIAVYAGWQDRARRETGQARRKDAGVVMASLKALPRYALGIAVTSLVAGLATGIFAAYHFGRVAPYGLLANLLAMPVVTILVMPLAVAAVIAMPFGLHVLPFRAMAWAVERVIGTAEWVAGLSPAVPVGQMPATALLGFTAGLAALCLPSTWLRLVSLPMFLVGVLFWRADTLPLAVISEDGRQFAVIEEIAGGSALHVNRSRPNAFILEQWTDAYRGRETVKPAGSGRMACDEMLCVAEIGAAAKRPMRIAYVAVAASEMPSTGVHSVRELCADHDLVVFAKAPSPPFCANGTPTITAQMLALRGAAEIRPDAKGEELVAVHALPGPVRPWLDHRRYSRPARNLGEWKPRGSDQ